MNASTHLSYIFDETTDNRNTTSRDNCRKFVHTHTHTHKHADANSVYSPISSLRLLRQVEIARWRFLQCATSVMCKIAHWEKTSQQRTMIGFGMVPLVHMSWILRPNNFPVDAGIFIVWRSFWSDDCAAFDFWNRVTRGDLGRLTACFAVSSAQSFVQTQNVQL